MDQFLTWVADNAAALGVIVPVVIAIAGGIGGGVKWVRSRRSDPAAPPRGVRHNLPRAPATFTGRMGDVRSIGKALRGRGAVVTALHGMGGIGKTATALYAAQRLLHGRRFKDAQLFIDLHGYTPGRSPLSPEQALKDLLRAFVSPDQPLPEDREQLSGEWQARTRGLDMLLVLDNARDEDQVRPLLPNHPTCTVLVTSRKRFGLPDIATIPLDEMTVTDAADLALRLANTRERRRLDRRQAEALAKACAYHPLAIELAAGNLLASHGLTPAELTAKISSGEDRFLQLERGERSVRAALLSSLEALPAETRAQWAVLGVFEDSFDAKAAAAVWRVEHPGWALDELEQRSLVRFDLEGKRYHLHDLLRAVALEQLAEDPARQHEVQSRHAEHFFTVLQAANALYLAGHDNVGRGLALLDAELANVRAGQRWAANAMTEDGRAAELAQRLPNHNCLWVRLTLNEHLAWLETSVAAAERRGDREGEVEAAGNLGLIHRRRGELDRAEAMLLRGISLYEELGHKYGMARNYGNLGMIYHSRGDLDRAEEMYCKSLKLNEEVGRKEEMARQYGNLGGLYRDKGQIDRAEEMSKESLALAQEIGSKEGMAIQSGNLGLIYQARGQLDCAEQMFKRSLATAEELGYKESMATSFGNLGSLYEKRGDISQSVAYWRKSLALYREIGAQPMIEEVSGWLRAAGVDPERDDVAT